MLSFIKNFFIRAENEGEKSSDSRKRTGGRGEKLAADYLKGKGFIIMDMNFTCPLGEIDIVARKGNLLVICEVKTRKSKKYGSPELAVNHQKRARLIRLAKFYVKQKKLYEMAVRFDVISIYMLQNEKPELKHIEAAFTS